MSSLTKLTEQPNIDSKHNNKQMNNTFSALPYQVMQDVDMITSRAIDESIHNDKLESPNFSELNLS